MTDADVDIALPPPSAAPDVDALALTRTLVDQLLSKARPELAEGMRLAAIPEWFDADLLAALRGKAHDDGLTPRIFDRIRNFSFVSELPGMGDQPRLHYSSDVHTVLLATWDADPQGLAAAHRRAMDYFEELARHADHQGAIELHLAALNHRIALETLLGAAGDGLATLVAEFENALEDYRLAQAENLLGIGRSLQPRLAAGQALWIDYMAARMELSRRRFAEARTRLSALLARPELPAALRPHVEFALGDVLVESQDWHSAVENYRSALKAFQQSGRIGAAARTMVGLAHAHLDLAYNIWGQRHGMPAAQWTWRSAPGELFDLAGRIPILIYLLLQLGPTLLTSIWQIARGQDWLVARLFVTAADWLHRAEDAFLQTGDQDGAALTRSERARLYLALGDPWRAARYFESLITHPGVIGDEYRLARVRLGLSAALVQQHRPVLALEVIDRATQVFEAYRDTKSMLEARLIEGQARAALQQAAPAVDALQRALNAAQAIGDVPAATEIAHLLTEIADAAPAGAPSPDAQAPVERARTLAAGVTRRTYLVPYAHPWLFAFNRLSLWLLAAAIFLIPLLTIRPVSAVNLVAGTVLQVAPYIPANGTFDRNTALSPTLRPELTRLEAQPQFHTDLALLAALFVAGVYTFSYTVLGLILVVRTPLRQLQTGQSGDVTLDEHGIRQGDAPPIEWSAIDAYVVAELAWRTTSVPSASYHAVLSGPRTVTVPGHMPFYDAVAGEVARRVPPGAQRGAYRHTLLSGFYAWLFGVTAVYIALFALASIFARDWVTTDFIGPYSLADLFTFVPLGLLIPMIHWLITGPLRARLIVNPHTLMPWAIGAAGGCLALAGLVGVLVGGSLFGRPEVLPAIAGMTLGGISTIALWGARARDGRYVYPTAIRTGLLALLAVTSLLSLVFVGLKLAEYHFMILGNDFREQGRAALAQGRAAEAPALLQSSVASYGTSLEFTGILTRTFRIRSDAGESFNARGIVYLLLGTALGDQDQGHGAAEALQAAAGAFAAALGETPNSAALYANRGVAYESLSNQLHLDGAPDAQTNAPLRLAVADFLQAALRDPHNEVYPFHAASIYLMLDDLDLSRAEYDQALAINPNNAAAHTGVGFVLYLQAVRDSNSGRRSALLNEAILEFSKAIDLLPDDPSAYTGLGYAYYARGGAGDLDLAIANFDIALDHSADDASSLIMRGTLSWLESTRLLDNGRTPCRRAGATDEEIKEYRGLIHGAIDAYSRSLALSPNYPPLVFRRGQLHFLLARCKGESFVEQYEAGLADTNQAIALDPTQVSWYTTAGNFHYALSVQPGHDYVTEIDATIDRYQQALALMPGQVAWFDLIGDLEYDVHDEPGQDALARLDLAAQSYRQAVALGAPGTVTNTLAKIEVVDARVLYEQGDFRNSAAAARRALALVPRQVDGTLTLGLALLASGDDVEAGTVLSAAVPLVDAIPDPVTFPRTVQDIVRDLQALRDKRAAAGASPGPIEEAIAKFQALLNPTP
jgi:tetratricopeptide (TPR) repeat protein